MAAMTRENSLICERFRLVMKLVLLPAPVAARRGAIVTKREPNTNNTRMEAMVNSSAVGAIIFMPSEIKKSVRKKSRSGSVFAVT